MKKFKISWALLAIATCVAFTTISCGSDSEEDPTPNESEGNTDQPGNTTPPSDDNETTFPEFTTMNGYAGDTLSISFTVNDNWQLTTNTLWCKLDKGLYDISGNAGSHEVKVIITDANWGFVTDSTEISMKINQVSQVIAKVYRAGKNYEISVIEAGVEENKEFDEYNPIVIDHYGSITLQINANFEWIPECNVEWLEITKEQNTILLNVLSQYTQNPINDVEDCIKFNNESETLLTIPVSYKGMNPHSIIIEPSSKWNMHVSVDGKSYSESSMSDSEAIISQAPYEAKLTTVNDLYTILSYNLDPVTGMVLMEDEASKWFTVTDDKQGNISVSFKPNEGAERSGYLMAIPQAHYLQIQDSLESSICDMSSEYLDMKPEYEKYTIAHFVQEAMVTSELPDVTASYTTGSMKSIPTEMLTSINTKGDIFNYVTTTFVVTSVAYLQPDIAKPFQITPSVEGWCEEEDYTLPVVAVYADENSTDDITSEFSVEGFMQNNKMALQFNVPETRKGSVIYVVFKKGGQNKQVAVIDMRD